MSVYAARQVVLKFNKLPVTVFMKLLCFNMLMLTERSLGGGGGGGGAGAWCPLLALFSCSTFKTDGGRSGDLEHN